VNGYTPATGDVAGLAYALQRLIEDEDLRRRQGRGSLARIQQMGYQQCLEGLRAALEGLEFRGSARNFELQTNRSWAGRKRHSCVALRAFTPTITPPTRWIARSCGAFAIIWPRADLMAWASGIRKTSVWASGIAG